MPSIKLNDRWVKSVKSTDAAQTEYWDTSLPGFGLRVAPGGTKTWLIRYRINGRRPRFKLGTYPPLGLADARERAQRALREVALGTDPAALRSEDRNAESYVALAESYLEKHARRKKKSWNEDERILKKEILPRWGHIKAKDITRKDVRKLLDDTISRGAPVHANRVLALVRKIFNFGISEEIVAANPCIGVPRPTKERARERVLTASEIKLIWNSIETSCDRSMAVIFKLGILLGQRGVEVRSMEWSEIDLETNWWTIPGLKTKNGLTHRVYLSPQARRLIESVVETKEYSRWVFPSLRNPEKHINNPQKAIQRVRSKNQIQFVGHDFRRTMTSHLTSMGIARHVAKRVINHVERDVTSIYDRYSYDKEKRDALELWGKRVEEIVNRSPDQAEGHAIETELAAGR